MAETAVWPNFFLMNVFFALKGYKPLLLSILYGPIQVLSGIVILKKYFGSVGIQVFAI